MSTYLIHYNNNLLIELFNTSYYKGRCAFRFECEQIRFLHLFPLGGNQLEELFKNL